jgi:hypothetical protein
MTFVMFLIFFLEIEKKRAITGNFGYNLNQKVMALTWRSSAAYIPEPATDIWIRVYWWNGEPVLAQFESTNQTVVVNDNGLIIPFWAVSRWAYPD